RSSIAREGPPPPRRELLRSAFRARDSGRPCHGRAVHGLTAAPGTLLRRLPTPASHELLRLLHQRQLFPNAASGTVCSLEGAYMRTGFDAARLEYLIHDGRHSQDFPVWDRRVAILRRGTVESVEKPSHPCEELQVAP